MKTRFGALATLGIVLSATYPRTAAAQAPRELTKAERAFVEGQNSAIGTSSPVQAMTNLPAIFNLLKATPDDPQIVAALERALLAPNIDSHYARSLCEAAAEAGTSARGLKSALKKMLTFHTDWVAHEAFAALGKVEGGDAATSVPAALEVLHQWPQTTPEKMSVAMLALQNAGAEGKPALPRLVQLWNTRQPPYLRHAIIRTIGKIGPGSSADATQLLFDSLNAHPNTGQGGEAVSALRNFREGDKEAVPVLLAALPHHPSLSAGALGKIGPAAQPAAAQLLKLAQTQEKSNYANIEPLAVGLMSIGPQAKGASQVALKALDSWEIAPPKYYDRRGLMLAAIAKTDTPTDAESRKRLLAHIVKVFKAPWEWNQTNALGATMAAGALGPDAEVVVPDLVRVIERTGADQGHSADFRATYNWTDYPAEGFSWGDYDVFFLRREAIRALAKMGTAAQPAIPALTKIASITTPQPNYGLRLEAAQALRALGKTEAIALTAKDFAL